MSARLARRRYGVSALFDSMLFFMLMLAATAALFLSATSVSRTAAEDLSTRYMGQQAADIQSSALGCTVGPLDYEVNGTGRTFTGNVLDCIRTILEVQSSNASCRLDGLCGAVRGIFGLLVPRPLHFALLAVLNVTEAIVSDAAGSPARIPAVRWTSAIPLIIDGLEGELTLFLWR